MTETTSVDVIYEAIAMIDVGLAQLNSRELVLASDVADQLLDLRLLLLTGVSPQPEPAGV